MKRKLVNVAISAACCIGVLMYPSATTVQATPTTKTTMSTDNSYKDTTAKSIVKETKETVVSNGYDNIGIANVNNYLNIRTKANENADIIGMLPKDAGCYIYSIDQNGWAKIKSGDITGYVSSEYLIMGEKVIAKAKKVAEKIATVTAVTVRVREEDNTNCKTLCLVPKGEEVEVIDDSNENWVKVCIDDDKGYISKDYVDVKYQLKKALSIDEESEAITASTSSVSNSSIRSKMVDYAKKFIGGKYVYGGTSLENGIDCSAFMMRIYQHFGYNISRTSRSQAAEGDEIKLNEVKPGDLVFYEKNGTISHVAMYIGNGKIIHASNRRSGIKISNMYYKVPCKACRFLND